MARRPKPTRTIGYIRVSTAGQADSGTSLDAQQAQITKYSELYDLDLVAIEEDAGASARTLDRPGLQRVLAMLDGGDADALLVAKLDRLTRSIRDLGDLVETYFSASSKLALLSVGENIDTRSAAGRLVLNVLASVSQWEREAIGERTSAAMRHMRNRGEYTGGRPPYGFKLGREGHLVSDRREQAIIKLAHELRSRGMSLRKIATELEARGSEPRSGPSWSAEQIRCLLKRSA